MYCVLPAGQRKASPHAPPSQPRSHTASHSASALHASSASTIVSYQPYRRSEQCAACSRTYGRGGGGALGSGIVGGSGGDAGGAGGGRDGDGTGGDGGGGDGGGRKRGPQSEQSWPSSQTEKVDSAPPSSHSPSDVASA